ncbi:helix-turn-helix domain-containing protein [Vibrio amylolyticus]|uniref:helix-turn-helix domain-containing protein n=1 Tax=Vibrio TaxID=662 RepID=UPI000C823C95|nr:helix-turn-helix transcriptional regulator [Vibrio sp. 10N.261.55.A7]PMJ98150.1 transcriptional regulator [Vibrio sp. 10N.261.55.A7]
MTICINLDIMMAKRKMRLKTLAQEVGITEANLSVLKNGKAKAVRLSTLDKLCEVLECQPGDILAFEASEDDQ